MGNNGVKTKIFVISLKGSDKRRASIKQQFDRFGIAYEIVDAVRGADLDIENDKRIDQEAVRRLPHWLTPGAIGCSLSHIECYSRAIAEELDYITIVEDDAKIDMDFSRYLDTIFHHLKDKQIALLYYTSWEPIYLDKGSKVILDEESALYDLKEGLPITTTAYVLNRNTCVSLLEGSFPIRVSCDSWNYYIQNNILNSVACVYPNPVDTMDFKSDIAYHDTGWKQKISKLVDKHQIFPFYQIMRELRRRSKLKMKQTIIS